MEHGRGTFVVLALLLVWIGVYPGPVLDLIRAAVSGFG